MRNPLSLHSGLGSLLFLSLVPVALSLPVGGGNGWPPYGFQDHSFQDHSFQNYDFQSQNPSQWPQSSLQSVVTQQGPNVPQHQFPQQHLWGFGNAPQLAHLPHHQLPQHQFPQQHLWGFGNAPQLAHVPQHQLPHHQLPQHQFPQQHLWSYGNAPQPAQIPPGFSSTSHILPDDEWDRLVSNSALQGPPRRESLIPPPLPPSHAGWYPSSSEAREFLEPGPSYNHAVELRQNAEGALQRQNEPDVPLHGSAATAMHSRVSNKGASSSGTTYKLGPYRFKTPEEVEQYAQIMRKKVDEPNSFNSFKYSASPLEKEIESKRGPGRRTTFRNLKNDVFEKINEKIFNGKLIKVNSLVFGKNIWNEHKKSVHQPSRVLPFVELTPQPLPKKAGTIKNVRMTAHHVRKKLAQEAASVGADGSVKTFYHFWGIPEGRDPNSQKTVDHYGMGYVKPRDFKAVNDHLNAMTEAAKRFH
ncbi:hypothetical protein NDA11_000111 [Ustilago hordei]|nr:hypothetical protein NDA11_000111 [Ustilago hordei]